MKILSEKAFFEAMEEIEALHKKKQELENQIQVIREKFMLDTVECTDSIGGTDLYEWRCAICGKTWNSSRILPCTVCNKIEP